jgi:3-hydroxyacyl-CoA dehydrogenase/enoyl-CoA hydratase/3-hydroxybutyryl-CoA epimerase
MSARSWLRFRALHRRTLSYIDFMGLKNFVEQAKRLQKRYGPDFKSPKLLLEMAEKGETFYERFNPYAKTERKDAA